MPDKIYEIKMQIKDEKDSSSEEYDKFIKKFIEDLSTLFKEQLEKREKENKENTIDKKIQAAINNAKVRLNNEKEKKIAEIEKFYNEQNQALKKEAEKATTPDDIQKIKDTRVNLTIQEEIEKEKIKNEYRLKSLEAEAKLIDQRIAISGKYYLFESDKKKESLLLQKENAEAQLKTYESLANIKPSDELSLKIEETKVKIEGLDQSLEKLSFDKFKEIATLATQISASVKGLLGDLGIKLDARTAQSIEGMEKMLTSFASIDMNKPGTIITGTINILGGLLKTISGIFGKENKVEKDSKQLKNVTTEVKEINEANNKLLTQRINLIKQAVAAEAGYLNQITQDNIDEQKIFQQKMFERLNKNEIFGKKGRNNNLSLSALMEDLGIKTLEEFATWWNQGGYQKYILEGYDLRNKEEWDAIVNSWTQLGTTSKEATKATQEAITGISFDSFKDSLDDLVKQADLSFEDISNSFGDNMSKAILRLVKNKYLVKELEKWYAQFEGFASDGNITKDEADISKKYYQDIIENANKEYKNLFAQAGIDLPPIQGSTGTGIAPLTQDSVNQLNGNFNNMLRYSKDSLLVQQAMNTNLDTIVTHTSYLINIKNSLEDIQVRGIKMKV